jgi:hypothetical protein
MIDQGHGYFLGHFYSQRLGLVVNPVDKTSLFKNALTFPQIPFRLPSTPNNLSFSIRHFKQFCAFQGISQQLMWKICLLTAISANFGQTHPLAVIEF